MAFLKKILFWVFIGILSLVFLFVMFYLLFCFFVRPSNDRDWSVDMKFLPKAEIKENLVSIKNIRNFKYKSILDYEPGYYDKVFDLNKLERVDFFVEPFSTLSAHTFLSFGFSGGEQLAVSVEARREKGEWFSGFKGFFRKFELAYVVADENDVLKLRTNYRKGDVYMYPIKISKEKLQLLFLDIMARVNQLYVEPEFYNTVWNNCTTNIVRHVNNVASLDKKISWSYKYEFPVFAGRLAFDLGLVDAVGDFETIEKNSLITPKALQCGDCKNFSEYIRK